MVLGLVKPYLQAFPSLDEPPPRYVPMHPMARPGVHIRGRRPDPLEVVDRILPWPTRVLVIAALAGLSWVVVATVMWAVGIVL